jgi:hypothetical protein
MSFYEILKASGVNEEGVEFDLGQEPAFDQLYNSY